MQTKRHKVKIDSDGLGDGSATIKGLNGLFMQVLYAPDGISPYLSTTDLTIKGDGTSLNILDFEDIGSAPFKRAPRHVICDAADGSEGVVLDYIAISEDLTITISGAGADNTGVFYIYTAY